MSSEKTEQPTDKRLRDAREKGDIAKSNEVSSAAAVLAAMGYFIGMSLSVFQELASVVDYTLKNAPQLPYEEGLQVIGRMVISMALSVVVPLVAAVLAAVTATLLAQTGFLFAPKAAIPKLSNLNPGRWFKQVFSKKNLFELCKNIIKVTVLSVAVYIAANNHIRAIFMLPQAGIGAVWQACGSLLKDLALYTIGAFSVLAAIDYVYTRFRYTKEHMMAPEEVKQEFKESEGDPHIKQKRKQLHQEMANQATLAKTRKAKVLIVNPTHYAVAVDYETGRTKLPVILAKGQGEMARRMIETAKQEHIPVMRQPALARALYAQGEEDAFVPSDLLIQVAEVLRLADKLRQA